MRYLVALVALSMLVGCDDCKKSGGGDTVENASPADVKAATDRVQEVEAARKAALASAKTTAIPRMDLGACPVETPHFGVSGTDPILGGKTAWGGFDIPRYDERKGNDILANMYDELAAIDRLGIEYASEVGVKPGPNGFRLQEMLRSPSPSKWESDDLKKLDGTDFELVIDDELPPKIVSDTAFEAGIIRARFYVWDNVKKAIVCAARVTAESSDRIRATGTDQAQVDLQMKSGLVSDLREQALAAVKANLYVAGPPRSTDDHEAVGDASLPRVTKDGGR